MISRMRLTSDSTGENGSKPSLNYVRIGDGIAKIFRCIKRYFFSGEISYDARSGNVYQAGLSDNNRNTRAYFLLGLELTSHKFCDRDMNTFTTGNHFRDSPANRHLDIKTGGKFQD